MCVACSIGKSVSKLLDLSNVNGYTYVESFSREGRNFDEHYIVNSSCRGAGGSGFRHPKRHDHEPYDTRVFYELGSTKEGRGWGRQVLPFLGACGQRRGALAERLALQPGRML